MRLGWHEDHLMNAAWRTISVACFLSICSGCGGATSSITLNVDEHTDAPSSPAAFQEFRPTQEKDGTKHAGIDTHEQVTVDDRLPTQMQSNSRIHDGRKVDSPVLRCFLDKWQADDVVRNANQDHDYAHNGQNNRHHLSGSQLIADLDCHYEADLV